MKNAISIFLIMIPLCIFAQKQLNQRVVYLWDVTYSMHGGYFGHNKPTQSVTIAGRQEKITQYDSRHDIYDKILNALVADISRLNERTEVIVIPFGSRVLDCWKEHATAEGKSKLIAKIQSFNNISSDTQKTGISAALEYAQSNVFKADMFNILKLLTDGGENVNPTKFYYILDNWCNFAEEKKVQGYYFILSDEALKGNAGLQQRLEKDCITVIKQLDDVVLDVSKSFVTVTAASANLLVTDIYNKPISLNLNFEPGEVGATCNLSFIVDDNPYFSIDKTIRINAENRSVELTPKFLLSLAEIREQMPTEEPTKVQIKISLPDTDEHVQLLSDSIGLNIINKKLKKITISLKK